jgi:hypothetical protein
MDGLLLRLLQTESNEPRFWKLFASLREEFDRLFWCLTSSPWMGAPEGFHDDSVTMRFPGDEGSGTVLWQPGYLSRYGDKFSEETVELWAIDPACDDPSKLVSDFGRLHSAAGMDKFIDEHAYVWLIYLDSTSWEIYAQRSDLVKRLHDSLLNEPSVAIFRSQSNRRATAFAAAGLSQFWRNMQGDSG